MNYKEFPNLRKPLRKSCPNGVDIYFDNVGGDISDNVLYMLNDYARIIISGQIALYNMNRISTGPRLYPQLLIHRAKMQGFIVYDFKEYFSEAKFQLAIWLSLILRVIENGELHET